jgi:LysR family transcriptional regulator, glycine cleavage system transcriptional activator
MSDILPPLNALRAFTVAARHLSITKAAEELHVTPAAVSHQVKLLEEFVGAPLFIRLTRALKLTDRGQAALPVLSEGFDRLQKGAALLSERQNEDVLTVTTTPAFAAQWLVPRLADFQERHPEIKVRLEATISVVDLRRDGVDVGIRWGPGAYPGLDAQRLFDEEIFPVCSPRLLAGAHPLTSPHDLIHHTLLHASDGTGNITYADWRMWLNFAGATEVDWRKGPEFAHENMTVQAAVEGHGVALVVTSLVRDNLALGTLVKPFEQVLPTDFSYCLVTPRENREKPAVRAFQDWVLDKVSSIRSE